VKTPFILCVLEDHSQEEAASILGTSPKAVELRIYRARSRLRAALA
jgi:RNA polymerase sigma-70 factor (ECF subfamily)